MLKTELFTINVPQDQLDDLRHRLSNTRWPAFPGDGSWDKGTPAEFLMPLMEYWRDSFNWRDQEAVLNQLPHFRTEIDGVTIHYIHIKGKGPAPEPLILTHGWPDSFTRYLKLIPYLTDPARHGGNASDSFDVIIPSIPGFGFSLCAHGKSLNNADVAHLWSKLMTQVLGYKTYCAHGGDIGSGITRYLASFYPDQLRAVHLTDVGIIRDLMAHPDPQVLGKQERAYKKSVTKWMNQEAGYMSIQATKPRSLAYGLNDSPAGLAAWIVEKYFSWSYSGEDLFSHFSRDEILTNISLYWFTGSAGTSVNMYRENASTLPPLMKNEVPVGVACYPADILPPPRAWAEKTYNICRWSEMPRGGHFAAMEEPEIYAKEITEFFRYYRVKF